MSAPFTNDELQQARLNARDAEIRSLRSQLEEARAKIRRQREIAAAALLLCNALPYSSEAGELEETIRALLTESKREYVDVEASERGGGE